MLLRLDTVEEIGRFSKLRHKAPQFPKLTLIYARNGYGKSTISSILRSIAEDEPQYIAARKRLGASNSSTVRVEWKGRGTVSFADGKWNSCPGGLHIFDQEYVQKNVHLGDSVTIEHKRSLFRLVLGSGGVELAEKIISLDAEQKNVSNNIASLEKNIRALVPIVSDVKAFCSAPIPSHIETALEDTARKLARIQKASTIRKKENLKAIPLKAIAYYVEVLGRSLVQTAENAAAKVNDHLMRYGMDERVGGRWLRFGAQHTRDGTCPFCTQDVSTVNVVATFQTFFSEEYAALDVEVQDAAEEIKNLTRDDGALLGNITSLNGEGLEFWRSVAPIDGTLVLAETEIASALSALGTLERAFEQKQQGTHLPIAIENEAFVRTALHPIFDYNARIAECVPIIDAARNDAGDGDVEQVKAELARLQATQSKKVEPLKSQAAAYSEFLKRQSELAKEKKEAQTKLRDYSAATFESRQAEINSLLASFGANFEIADSKASYVGREPNADYSLLLSRQHKVRAGEAHKIDPCFKTVLSTGDKFTLALALFIAQVRSDPNIEDATIILDDPFSSQDLHRQWETASQIRDLASTACQVVVLSHDPRFLNLIHKDAGSDCAEFRIECSDDGDGCIREWSSAGEIKSLYVRQAERIKEFAYRGKFLKDSNEESLIKDIRPFLEDFIRARFPGRFADLTMLDAMTDEIELAGVDDPMFKDVRSLRALNEYSRSYMHGGAPPPDHGQLRAQCQRVMTIVGAY